MCATFTSGTRSTSSPEFLDRHTPLQRLQTFHARLALLLSERMAPLLPAAHTGQKRSPLNNPNIPMEKHPDAEEMWRAEVTGESPPVRPLRRWLKLLPHQPPPQLCTPPLPR